MDERHRPFAYRLAAVLRKDRWEGEVLGAEATRALRLVEECQRRQEETLARVAQAETELRELCGERQSIPLDRRRILHLFLRDQYALAEARALEHAKADGLYAQVLHQLASKRRSIQALEHHEERQRQAHAGEQARAAFKANDAAWLVRRQQEEGR
jgi:hypothetical protein